MNRRGSRADYSEGMSPNVKSKGERTVVTSVRLHESLVLKIDQRAASQGISRNAEISQALEIAYGDTTTV